VEKYKVSIKHSAVKEIEAIPQKKERQRIISRIGQLANDPRPQVQRSYPVKINIGFAKVLIVLYTASKTMNLSSL